jgi:hypothetical protein
MMEAGDDAMTPLIEIRDAQFSPEVPQLRQQMFALLLSVLADFQRRN